MLYNSGYLALDGYYSTATFGAITVSGSLVANGLVSANLGLNVLTGQTLNVGTSGTTSPLNVYGLITSANGLTVSSGATSLQSLAATTAGFSGLATASAGLTVANGQTLNVGTSGTTSILRIYGTLTCDSTATFNGAISAAAGLTVPLGQTLSIPGTLSSTGTATFGTLGATTINTTNLSVSATLSVAGLSATATTLTTLATSGKITANAGIDVATGQTLNVGTSGTTSPLNVYGLITGYNGLLINTGSATFQALSASSISSATTLGVGTVLTVSGSTSLQAATANGAMTFAAAVVRTIIQTSASSYTVAGTENAIEFTANTGAVAVTLPAVASHIGKEIILMNATTGNAVINITSTSKINGENSVTLTLPDSGSSSRVVAGNASWYIV